MKVKLPSGRVVKVGTQFGNEKPVLVRPLPPEIADKPFRSVRLRLTVMAGDEERETLTGVSYCNPADQFSKSEGRKKAMRRLFEENRQRGVLSKKECRAVASVLLTGKMAT